MDVVFSIQNYAIIKVLPVVPPDIEIKRTDKSETFNSIQQGEMELMGGDGIEGFQIRSFFPNRKYDFIKPGATYSGDEYVHFFKATMDAKIPMKACMTFENGDILFNAPVKIKSFNYSADQAGDISYTLSCVKYKFVKV